MEEQTLFPDVVKAPKKHKKRRADNGQFCTQREAEIIKRYEARMNHARERDRRKIEALLALGSDIYKLIHKKI